MGAEEFWIVTERCIPGPFDSSVLYYKNLDESEMRCAIHCVLKALDHLHKLGVVHGDIKAGNTLLDSTGKLKVCDFGSTSEPSKKERGSSALTLGTLQFAPPEVLDGYLTKDHSSSIVTFKLDVWSLGIFALQAHDIRQDMFQDVEMTDQQFVDNVKNRRYVKNFCSQGDVSDKLKSFELKAL